MQIAPPRPGTPINWGNKLTKGLVAAWLPYRPDARSIPCSVNPKNHFNLLGAKPEYGTTATDLTQNIYPGLKGDGTALYGQTDAYTKDTACLSVFSASVIFTFGGHNTRGNNTLFFVSKYGSGGGANWDWAVGIKSKTDSGSADDYVPWAWINANGNQLRADTGFSNMTIGRQYQYHFVCDGTNGYFYIDGVNGYTGAYVGPTDTATNALRLFNTWNFDDGNQTGTVSKITIWNAALTPADVAQDLADPWGLWVQDKPIYKKYFVASAATASTGNISPADSFAATSAALKAAAGAITPGDSFAATSAALKQAAGAISPADSFAATSKALKASAGDISPADSFSAGSTKLAASAGSFSPAEVFDATSAALKAAAGNFSPGDSFAATANTGGSQGAVSPSDSFAATGASRAAGAGAISPADAFTATMLELGAGAGSFNPADAFTGTGAALRAGAGGLSPGDSFAATSRALKAAVGSCSPADSFGATGASLFKFTGNISPADDFSAASPSVGGAQSKMFLTTAR